MNSKLNKPGEILTKIAALAGSRTFSVFVLVMAITYVLILAVFGLLVETKWLEIMAGLFPFQLLYALFFLNLILIGIKWLPVVVRQCRNAEMPQPAEKYSLFNPATAIQGAGFRVQEFTRYLKRRGYQVRVGQGADNAAPGRPATLVYACSGHYSPIGNLLFHAAFLLILVGVVVNLLYRFEGLAVIAEGRPFSGGKAEYRTIEGDPPAALPEVDFDVEKITAEFWGDRLFFTRLEAQLLHRGGRDVAKLSSAVQVGNAAVTIAGYGYVPMYQLKNRSGDTLDQAYVKLNIFSPGSEDHFQVRGYPHKVFVSFYPDYTQVAGKIVNKSMNPVNPTYFLRILRGRLPVFIGAVKPGQWAEYDGLRLSFPSYVKSGDFQIVRNPGHPFIWTAFIMMGAGLVWKLFFYRKQVTLWQDDAGRTWLAGHFDYYPQLHADWLVNLADQFQGPAA